MNKSIFIVLIFFLLTSDITGQLPIDRQIDWTNAGLRDTTTNNFTIINLIDLGINGDGITPNDDLIATVLSDQGTDGVILKFPEGTFLFNESINLSSNSLLVGEGATKTSLISNLGGSGHSINIAGTVLLSDTTVVIATGQKDDNFLEVNNVDLFQSGDWIQLTQVDSHLVTSIWAEGTVGQIMQVEDIIDQKIFFGSTLRKTYKLEDNPVITKISPIENVGISCLKIVRQDNTAPSQSSNIRFNYAVNCWVSSIESSNCTFSHIEARFSSNLKIEKSYLHDAFGFGGGGRAYGIMLHLMSNEVLVENNIFKRLRHSMILQAGANGNVLVYNYSFDPFWTSFPSNAAGDMVLHGNYIFANLFEQNIGQNIVIDNSHGPNGPNNTFFRNKGELFGIFFSATNSPGQNFIGNEITNTSAPYNLVNYTIQGADHFILSNNNKGNIDPPGSDTLSTQSLYYDSIPNFVPADQWASIGTPNLLNKGSIPSFTRIQNNDPFLNTCGEILTSTKDQSISDNKVNVFPNPFSELINIHSEKKILRVDIYDFSGKSVFAKNVNDNFISLRLNRLPAGIYTATIYLQDNKTSIKRIIK